MESVLVDVGARRQHDKTAFGQDKVAHYKWNSVKGHGQLMSIDKQALSVDHFYQRNFNNNKSNEIAKGFDWVSFGALVVARRPDRSLWVIDGQHRLAAAQKRSDVTHVPCVVYDAEHVDEEAKGFLDINVGRKPLTSFDKHRALVVRGDESTLVLEKMAKDNGFEISNSSKPNGIKCISVCLKLLVGKHEGFLWAFPLTAEICAGRHFDERVIEALVYLHDSTDRKIMQTIWRKAIVEMGYEEIRGATDRAAVFYQKGGAKVWATGLAEALNKRSPHQSHRHRLMAPQPQRSN